MILGFRFFLTCIDIHVCIKKQRIAVIKKNISPYIQCPHKLQPDQHTETPPSLATFYWMVWTFWTSSGKYYDILSAGFYLRSYTSDTVTVPNIQYEDSFSIVEIFCTPSGSLEIDRNSGDTGYQWLYFNYKRTSKSSRSIPLTIPCDCILWKLRAGWQKTTILETDSGMRRSYVLDRTQIPRSSANTSNQDLTYRGCTMCSLWTE